MPIMSWPLQLKLKAEEKAFGKNKKEYEKEEKNRKAYQAYIASKEDVYTTHHSHCDSIVITAMPLWIRRILLLWIWSKKLSKKTKHTRYVHK
jgi:hypothetical protein